MRKIMSVILVLALILIFSGVVTAVEAIENTDQIAFTSSGEEKVYFNATTEDEFADNRVMVDPLDMCEGQLWGESSSTHVSNGYHFDSGTSIAAPYVAGVAALLLSNYPDMTANQLKKTILRHAEKVYSENENDVFGDYCTSSGRLNARNVFFHSSSYSSISSDEHERICTVCEYCLDTQMHNMRYVATNSLYMHNYSCTICGYCEKEERHTWISTPEYLYCNICDKVSTAAALRVGDEMEVSGITSRIVSVCSARGDNIRNPFDYSLLSEELKEEIKKAFFSTFASELHWGEEYTSKQRYYGMFNESVVIFITPNAPTVIDGWKNSQTVGNYEFTYSYGFRMVVYNEGRFISITAAYDNGLLTDEDVGLIHSFHESFDMFMPPETGDSIAIPGIVTCMVVSGVTMALLLANKKKFT